MTPQMWESLAWPVSGTPIVAVGSGDKGERDRDDDDLPDTPTDEPPPEPIQDPPAEPGPQGPYVVGA